MNAQRRLGLMTLVGGITLLFGSVIITDRASAGDHHDHKVRICHATNAESNPYTNPTVDVSAVDGHGANDHSHHTGPVWYPGAKAAGVTWGDIIPPVHGVTSGLNWTAAGQAIWHHDCAPLPPVTTTTADVTTTTQEVTTTTQEVTTTTAEVTTTTADVTTTTEEATTTTADVTTTTDEATTTTVESEGPTTTAASTTTAPTLITTTTAVGGDTETLPSTGGGSTPRRLAGVGLTMIGLGSVLLALSRRRSLT